MNTNKYYTRKKVINIKIKDNLQAIETIIKSNSISVDGELVELHEEAINNIKEQILKTNAKANTEQAEQSKKGIEIRKEISEFEQALKDVLGSFYFNFYNRIPEQVERQYKFRFLYLCCYLKHEDNRLVNKINNKYILIKEGELMQLLKLSEREYYRTRKSLIDNKLITIDKDKNVHINSFISKVGSIPSRNKAEYTRVFKEGIKELYNNSNARDHKKIALFIELLPYIHFQYNVICKNTTCELMEDIEPYTLKELTEELKIYQNKNTTSLKKQLLNINIKNRKAMLMIEDNEKKFFVVNPEIYYRGTNITSLNYLINLFKI
jgi:hypothetical protein